jgi:hypothetical protein
MLGDDIAGLEQMRQYLLKYSQLNWIYSDEPVLEPDGHCAPIVVPPRLGNGMLAKMAPEQRRTWRREQQLRNSRRLSGIPTPLHPAPAGCECCGKPPRGFFKVLIPDHCHMSKKPRGWLCSGCNRALGLLGDDLPGVEQMRQYLLAYSVFAWMEDSGRRAA